MDLKVRYSDAKERLLNNPDVCAENRKLFKRFFEFEEYKLKRRNNISSIDNNSYRTLLAYISRLNVVNRWFKNKPWVKLTKADIKRVYDDIEDGKITTRFGEPIKDKHTYYKLILRGKPFEMAGKKDLVQEIMEFYTPVHKEEVRFIKEETFRKLVDVAIQPEHKALLWLCWDIGENCSSLLQLKKNDCTRQINSDTREPEYYINLRKEILKRSRKPRTEVTNYKETVQYLDLILEGKQGEDNLFIFEPRWAKKIIDRAAKITKAKCLPAGQPVTLKDLRSSMACDLLSKGWSTDEVNARLGHTPSSKEIDKYVNFLAIDRSKPKKKIFDNQMTKITLKLEEADTREQIYQRREQTMKESIENLKSELRDIQENLQKRESVDPVLTKLFKNKRIMKMIEAQA